MVERAFRKFEKGFVLPSISPGREVAYIQRSKSKYFEIFMGIDRPLTAEEELEALIELREVKDLSKLLELVEEMPEARQAEVKIEIGRAKASVKAGEILKKVAKKSESLVLLEEGLVGYVRIGRTKLKIDGLKLQEFAAFLKDRGLNY